MNLVLVLKCTPRQWGLVLIMGLLKGGDGRSRERMDDFRPIGLLPCPAKLWEQLMLPRLEHRLRPPLGAAQAGGSLGADAAALRLVDLRRAGSGPGGRDLVVSGLVPCLTVLLG